MKYKQDFPIIVWIRYLSLFCLFLKGLRCDKCSEGYRDFPACNPCPCDLAGSVGGKCEGDCKCKVCMILIF